MKCQCKCPDFIKVPIEHDMTETILLKGFGTVLHGKKATLKCPDCGTPLCEDCGMKAGTYTYIPYDKTGETFQLIDEYLCPTCG